MMNKITFLLFAYATTLLANPFQSALQNEVSWLKEETYIISASKIKEDIKKTPASVTVITDKTIEETGAKNIFDILNQVPGINITQSQIYFNKINVRGIGTLFSEKVLILLDGHSLNIDTLNGGATSPFKSIPVELIKRVEIIKGPASALYGENAFTALINIITKKAEDIDGTVFKTQIGSSNSKKINITHGKKYNNNSLFINVNNETSDGHSVFVTNDDSNNSASTNPTLDTTNLFLSLQNTNGLYVKGNYNIIKEGSKYGVNYIVNDDDLSKRESFFLETGIKKDLTNSTDLHIRAYYDKYTIDNYWLLNQYTNVKATVGNDTDKFGIESLFKIKKENYSIVSGISAEKQRVYGAWQNITGNSAKTFIDNHSRTFQAIYSEVLYDITKNLRVNAGLRYDHYDDFGDTTNPRVGLSWAINKNNNLKIMYGEAFRAPTFSELYNKNNPALQGNPNLKPETVKTTELSFENTSLTNLTNSFTFFNTQIQDIIVIENNVEQNKDEVTTRGIELETKYGLSRGSYLLANYTYQYAKNNTTNKELGDIARHHGFLALNQRVSKYVNMYTDITYTGSQSREATDTKDRVESSLITNVTIIVKNLEVKDLSFRFSTYNLFDTTTYDSNSHFDLPVTGRTYMAELTYKF